MARQMSEKPFEFTAANGVRWQLQVCSLLQCVQATEADLARALPVEVVRRLAQSRGLCSLENCDPYFLGHIHQLVSCAEVLSLALDGIAEQRDHRAGFAALNQIALDRSRERCDELQGALDGLEVALKLKQDEIDGLHEELRQVGAREELIEASRAIKPIRPPPPPLCDGKDYNSGDRERVNPAASTDAVAEDAPGQREAAACSSRAPESKEVMPTEADRVREPLALASPDCTSELAGAIVGK